MADKDSVIRGIYYDKDGFDSIINTYRKANKVLNTITLADVKSFIENKKVLINKLNRTAGSTVCILSFRTVIFDTAHIFCITPYIHIYFFDMCQNVSLNIPLYIKLKCVLKE